LTALQDELIHAVEAYLDATAARLLSTEAYVHDLVTLNLCPAERVPGIGAWVDQMKAKLDDSRRRLLLLCAPEDGTSSAFP
jgi:hypothetical protein